MEGASSGYEMMESMEVGDDRSLRKRKAETHDFEDGTDGGVGSGSGESGNGSGKSGSSESGNGSGKSGGEGVIKEVDEDVPEWGYDSYDEREYFSLSESGYTDSDDDKEARQKFLEYRRQIYTNRGFDVDPDTVPNVLYGGLFPVDLDGTDFWRSDTTARKFMERMVQLVLDKYNKEKKSNVKCERIVRAMAHKGYGIKSYITFMAVETPGAEPVEYQAKTHWLVWQENVYPIFCRPNPGPKDIKRKTGVVGEAAETKKLS